MGLANFYRGKTRISAMGKSDIFFEGTYIQYWIDQSMGLGR